MAGIGKENVLWYVGKGTKLTIENEGRLILYDNNQ
jgi:hypothetical protein